MPLGLPQCFGAEIHQDLLDVVCRAPSSEFVNGLLVLSGKIVKPVEGTAFVLKDANGTDYLIKLFGLPDNAGPIAKGTRIEDVLQIVTILPEENIDCVVRLQIKKLNYCECFLQVSGNRSSRDLAELVTNAKKVYEVRQEEPAPQRSLIGTPIAPAITKEEAFKQSQLYGEAERLAQKAGM